MPASRQSERDFAFHQFFGRGLVFRGLFCLGELSTSSPFSEGKFHDQADNVKNDY
jgi:hypothetical protein